MHKTERAPTVRLPERELQILAFERRQWPHAGVKEEAIRSEFGLSAARYYQLLNAVIDDPAAISYDPILTRRLRRMREGRASAAGTHPSTDRPDPESYRGSTAGRG